MAGNYKAFYLPVPRILYKCRDVLSFCLRVSLTFLLIYFAAAPSSALPLPLSEPATMGSMASNLLKPLAGREAIHSPVGGEPLHIAENGTNWFSYGEKTGLWLSTAEGLHQLATGSRASSLGATANLPLAWGTGPHLFWAFSPRISSQQNESSDSTPRLLSFSAAGTPQEHTLNNTDKESLDGVYWIGHSGLALGEFETKSGDADYAFLGMIDVNRGVILQRVEFKSILGRTPNQIQALVTGVDSHLNRQGRARVVFTLGTDQWFDWQEGSQPRPLQLGHYDHTPAFAVSPDFSSILVVPGLNPTGGRICEHSTSCTEPVLTSGVIAELRSLSTGRVRWVLRGAADEYAPIQKPVFSPDGRQALVLMPKLAGCAKLTLVETSTGKTLGSMCDHTTERTAFGFSEGGSVIWVSEGATTRFFEGIRSN